MWNAVSSGNVFAKLVMFFYLIELVGITVIL